MGTILAALKSFITTDADFQALGESEGVNSFLLISPHFSTPLSWTTFVVRRTRDELDTWLVLQRKKASDKKYQMSYVHLSELTSDKSNV